MITSLYFFIIASGVCRFRCVHAIAEEIDYPAKFLSIANAATYPRITDKYEPAHAYYELYGEILLPRVEMKHAAGVPIRFFEIGMGVSSIKQKPYKRGIYLC